MLYADARGACRVSRMTLSDGVWKIWREAPGFFQRFTATVSGDGKTITGRWEGSRDTEFHQAGNSGISTVDGAASNPLVRRS